MIYVSGQELARQTERRHKSRSNEGKRKTVEEIMVSRKRTIVNTPPHLPLLIREPILVSKLLNIPKLYGEELTYC